MTPRHFPWSLRRDPSWGELMQDVNWLKVSIGIGLIGIAVGLTWLWIIASLIMVMG